MTKAKKIKEVEAVPTIKKAVSGKAGAKGKAEGKSERKGKATPPAPPPRPPRPPRTFTRVKAADQKLAQFLQTAKVRERVEVAVYSDPSEALKMVRRYETGKHWMPEGVVIEMEAVRGSTDGPVATGTSALYWTLKRRPDKETMDVVKARAATKVEKKRGEK